MRGVRSLIESYDCFVCGKGRGREGTCRRHGPVTRWRIYPLILSVAWCVVLLRRSVLSLVCAAGGNCASEDVRPHRLASFDHERRRRACAGGVRSVEGYATTLSRARHVSVSSRVPINYLNKLSKECSVQGMIEGVIGQTRCGLISGRFDHMTLHTS